MQDMRKQGSLNRHEQSSYELIETGRKKIRFLQWNDTSGVKPTRADLMFKSSRSKTWTPCFCLCAFIWLKISDFILFVFVWGDLFCLGVFSGYIGI